MDSNTFWIMFGTSNLFTKSGLFHRVFITKMLQRIQENMESSLNILFSYLRIWKFANFRKFLKALSTFCLSLFILYMNMSISFPYYFLWRWGSENDEFPIHKISKSLDMNFIPIKTWNGNLLISTKYLLET